MSKFTYRMIAASLLATLALAGCGSGYGGNSYGGGGGGVSGGTGAISMISITPATASISVGATQQLTATAKDNAGTTVSGASLSWASSNTAVATVDGNGLATAVAVGSSAITASITYMGGVYGNTPVTITSNAATLTVTTMVAGTAAVGAPLAHAQVSLRDANGQFTQADADATGRFSIDVRGLTAPFLLKAEDAQGRVLFGAAAGVGQANVTPYSDLLVQQWYAQHGGDAAQAFARPGSALPDGQGLESLDHELAGVLKSPLTAVGLDAGAFSFLHTPFAADHTGFDALLDRSRIDAASGRIDVDASGRSSRYWLDPQHRRKLWHGDQNAQASGPEVLSDR